MIYLQSVLAIIFLALLFTLLGIYIKSLNPRASKDFPSLLVGFTAYIAIFQVIALPFLLTRANPKLFFAVIAMITLVWVLVSIFYAFINKHELFKSSKRYFINKHLIGVGLIIVSATVLSISVVRYDIDDSFYLGMAADNISSSRIYNHDPATGIQDYPMVPLYALGSYELFISFISFTTQLPVAVVAHFVLAALLIGLYLIAYYCLLKYLFIRNRTAYIAFTFFVTALLFAGQSPFLSGNFLLARPWQGKSLLIGVFVPIFIILTAKFLNRSNRARVKTVYSFIPILGVELAAFSSSPVSIYILPAFLLIVLLAHLLAKKGPKIQALADLFIIILPLTLVALGLKFYMTNSAGQIDESVFAQVSTLQWAEIASSFYGKSYVGLIIVIALSILVIQHKIRSNKPFFMGVLLASLILLNPLLAGFLSKYITTTATYWRLLWITLPEVIIASFCTLLFVTFSTRTTNRRQLNYIAPFALSVVVMMMYGTFLFQPKNGFSRTLNAYKVPNSAIATRSLPDNKIVLSDDLTSAYIRSVNPKLLVVYSRPSYMANNLSNDPQKLKQLNNLSAVVNGRIEPGGNFYSDLIEHDISYIIFSQDLNSLLNHTTNDARFKLVESTDHYFIWKVQ